MTITNEQRRKRIHDLKDQIGPLYSDRLMASFTYNGLRRRSFSSSDPAIQQQMSASLQKVNELTEQLAPLFAELRKLQVRYEVEFEAEVYSGGRPQIDKHTQIFNLSSDFQIESLQDMKDLSDPELWELLGEIKDQLLNTYTQFTILEVKHLWILDAYAKNINEVHL